MPEEENVYNQLLAQGYSKRDIDGALHKLLLHKIACKKAFQQLSFTGKVRWQLKHYSEQVTGFLLHLTAKGLILLKTQFAKKPKNPV